MKPYGIVILMTPICVVIFWIFMALRPAHAGERGGGVQSRSFWDERGNFAGSSIQHGNSTSLYDKSGNFSGSAIRNSDGTTSFYDKSGRFTGSSTQPNATEVKNLKRVTMKTFLKPLAIAALSIATLTPVVAQVPDELPYKEDGPERDFFLRGAVRFCMQNQYWLKLGANEKETAQFCDCRALALADTWTTEDDLEYHRAKATNTKVPAETYNKWRQADLACQKHFSKLPKAPERKK